MDDEKRKNEKLIQSLYVPKDILKASFDDMETDETIQMPFKRHLLLS